jgi:hypothetical protein
MGSGLLALSHDMTLSPKATMVVIAAPVLAMPVVVVGDGSGSGIDNDDNLHDGELEHPYYNVALSLIQEERLRIAVLVLFILDAECRGEI